MLLSNKSNDLLNRLETYRSLKDVKYEVYKFIHRKDMENVLKEFKRKYHYHAGSGQQCLLMKSSGYTKVAYQFRTCPHTSYYIQNNLISEVYKIISRKQNNAYVTLPERYWYSSPEIYPKIY